MSGVQTEGTSDTGGGLNVGFLDPGDWFEYTINVQTSGTYAVQYRVASQTGSDGFSMLVDGISRRFAGHSQHRRLADMEHDRGLDPTQCG